jgi:hypothetical protein
VSQNRPKNQPLNNALNTAVTVEVLRNAADAARACADNGKDKEKEKEESIPLFWRVFGGTVLSICSLIVMTAYSGFTGSLAEAKGDLAGLSAEVRKEAARLSEAQTEMIGKGDCETVMATVWRNLDELREDHKELDVLREQCKDLLTRFKTGEQERRRLMGELQHLREEQAADAERRALEDELGRLRERMVTLEARKAGH